MPTNIRNDRPLYEPLGALFDMGASAARGVTRGTLGLPGDLESLVRMITGGEQQLPTSEDWDKKLPKVTPLVADMKPFDDISMFYNIPIYGGTISAGSKGIKKLGGKIAGGDTSQSRRSFLKGSAALGAGGILATKFKLVDDALKELPKVENSTIPAKEASKYKFNSLKEYNDYLNSFKGHANINPTYIAKREEELYNAAKTRQKLGLKQIDSRAEDSLNAFSPQAKAEMKAFKQTVDDFKWDNAGGKMYDENPHMYNYPDTDTERLIEKYYEKDTTHWSDLLDDYLNNKYE